jgi:hypothetical protein
MIGFVPCYRVVPSRRVPGDRSSEQESPASSKRFQRPGKPLDGGQMMAGRYSFLLQVIDVRVVLSRS